MDEREPYDVIILRISLLADTALNYIPAKICSSLFLPIQFIIIASSILFSHPTTALELEA